MNRSRAVLLLVAIAAVVLGLALLPVSEWTKDAISLAESLGPVGAVVYGVAYVVATVLLVPGSALTLGAGFLYGILWGSLVVWPASVVGAIAGFWIGRLWMREVAEKAIAKYPRLKAYDQALQSRGLVVCLLLRLSPVVPFTLLNYALGASGIRPRDYYVGTIVGMVPGILLYVYAGSVAASLSELSSGVGGTRGTIFLVGGLLATAVAVWVVVRFAGQALKEFEQPQAVVPEQLEPAPAVQAKQ